MKSRTISRPEWSLFAREFSRVHNGALITMAVSIAGCAPRLELVDQPFRGLSEDRNGAMVVHLGNGGDRTHAGHRVEHVTAIHLHQTDEGADVALDVTALDGTRTTVRFRSPVLPELLDPAVE